jgi:butyryl-CoA dehydrogenase
MDFSLTEEQRMFQTMVRDFAKREVEPLAAQWDEEEEFPYEVIKKMADVGLCEVGWAEKYGGSGDELSTTILVEEIAHASAGLAAIVLVNLGIAGYPIIMHGSEEQKEKFIPRTVKGAISAFALTEATAGSDPAAVQTTYAQKDDGYVLNGTKTFITGGAQADWVVTFATRDRSLGYRGISSFIVERGTPGFSAGKLEGRWGYTPLRLRN